MTKILAPCLLILFAVLAFQPSATAQDPREEEPPGQPALGKAARAFLDRGLPIPAGNMVNGIFVPYSAEEIEALLAQSSRKKNTSSTPLASGFHIILNPGPDLQANPPALAAFRRAAAMWEAVIKDNVTVVFNADVKNLGNSQTLGQVATSIMLSDYDVVRNHMAADASLEEDDSIVSSLPTASQFAFIGGEGQSFDGLMYTSSANLKALGITSEDSVDGSISFNSNFHFDYDNTDGVDDGHTDFETVACHEIGHTLGFISGVDIMEEFIVPSPQDLFRFEDGTANDPATVEQFRNFPRRMVGGGDHIFDEVSADPLYPEFKLSTGDGPGGDNGQLGHWKDDRITNVRIGIMDPTLPAKHVYKPSAADLRVLDLIGYDISSPNAEIAVQQPEGTNLVKGGTVGFGSVGINSPRTLTFTVKNIGSQPLSVSGVSLVGGNAGSFTVSTAGTSTSLAALTGQTTFTVTFRPTAELAYQTTLRIASNDADEGTYDIILTGTGAPPLVVTTPAATNVGTSSATLGGTVTESVAGSVTGRGVVLSITSFNADPVIGGSYVEQISASGTTGAFTVQATSLGTPVSYSFRAYATYAGGVAYSPVATFSTLGNAPPTVTSPTAANIAATTATLGGNVTSAGTQPVTERGVCYALTSVNASPQPNNGNVTKVTTSGTTGVFTVNATGLLANSQYSYRAYALSAEGWGWSTVGTFTTPVTAPTLTTTVTLNEHARGATLVGRVNPNGMTVMPLFFYGKSLDQMSYQQATPSSVSGSSPVEVRYDLFGDVHTTYYYAVGYMIQGYPPVMASDVKTFTTVDTVPVASSTEVYVAEDGPYSVLLPAKDDDGDSLTASVSIPAHGTVSGGSYAPGYGIYVLYTPPPNFHGSDSFTFQARDPQGHAGTGTVTISVASINDPPTLNAIPNPAPLLEDAGTQTVSLSGISTGAPNETQTLTVTASSSNTALIPHPTVSYTSPNATGTLTFTPVGNARGLAVITVTVNDGETTTERTFLVTVNQVNEEPSFALPSSGLPAGETWTAQASGNRGWWAITSSADGTKLAAVVYGGSIYTSTDAGVTWVERPGTSGLWTAITSSADGRKLAAAANNGYIYTSTNAGLTWAAQQSSGNRKWSGIASSADGTRLAAASSGSFLQPYDYIYTSTDSGVTWTPREGTGRSWGGAIVSSPDGTKLAAASGGVFTSTNGGATWTYRDVPVKIVASSSDGTKLVAAGADVYTSSNSGVNWTWRLDGNRQWRSVASSVDGSRLAAVTGIEGQIYTSADAGLTWTAQAGGNRNWMSIASSADGSRLAAVVGDGLIYTSSAPLYNMAVSSGAGAMSIPSFATEISVGPPEETGQTVSFQVTNDNNALFSVQPAIAPNGTLTFTPNPTATPAKVTVSVTARDDGGTANGGVDTSFTQSFTITLTKNDVSHTYASASDVPMTSSAPVIGLGSTATLALGHAPMAGTELMVVKNTGLGFISGVFSNLAHGQTVSLSHGGETYEFVANYYGGTGNDLVLTWKNTRVLAWGDNQYGQIGNNSATQSLVPTATLTSGVLSGKTVVAVSTGYSHSLALCSDGTVAAWGYNGSGQLGNNSSNNSLVPVAVNTSGVLSGKTVVAVAAGENHSLALCSDGTVAAWGYNYWGQLGNNTTTSSYVPVAVNTSAPLIGKKVVAIDAGTYHSLALCSDGTVVAWGRGDYGLLGDDSGGQRNVPVAVKTNGVLSGKTVVSIAVGREYNLAICSDGTLVGWGKNSDGQLGNNSTTNSNVPVAVNTSGVLSGKTVVAIAAGGAHSVVLCSDGTLAAWGAGLLGDNSTAQSLVPVTVHTGGVLSGKTVVAVTADASHSLALCSDGTVAAWGGNSFGQLGNNSTAQSLVPVAVNSGVLASGERFTRLGAGGYFSAALAAVPTLTTPTVTTSAASGLAGTIATLNGTVNANGGSTTVTFHYGTTTSYGQTVAAQPAPVTGNSPVGVSAALSGLQPRTLYHFRLSATNAAGTVNSADATFTTPNSPPLAFGHPGLTTAEDSPMDILLGGLDADGDALTFAVATQPAHGTVSITGSTATYTPAANFSGDDSFTFTARDGFGGVSEPVQAFITVTPVNDPPTLAALSPLSVNEDAGWQTVDLTGIGTGAADEPDFLRVTASCSNPSLVDTMYVDYVRPASTGQLTLVLRPDAHGTATITVAVSDEVDTTSRTFELVVNPVNDAPSFVIPSGGAFTARDNAGFTAVPAFVTNISPGPANEAGQTVGFTVTNTHN